MLVPVRVDGAVAEWSVVELQGDLVTDSSHISSSSTDSSSSSSSSSSVTANALANVDIGTLRFADGVATLRVGNHVLSGKLAALPKPLAILQKVGSGDGRARVAGEESVGHSEDGGGEEADAVCYEVVGIARSRMVFSTRPKPVLVE